ncbi:MAG: bifunctional [glutamine synthetase] adenylyltransferase/[glutamine synthetase]-adenylyl-L-tyrosine phosphorylase [Acidimicrobiia bacterium]|nr:bifunctional [glutamine synthetase] adenylyltransferase/[glutamine synthetase]-adenylyl-L-tyrosine phosphorylase [Acidimicrobiia bacterium]
MADRALAQLIERSAAPAWAAVAAERIGEQDPDAVARFREDSALAEAFVTVTSASRALTELCLSEPAALEVLAHLGERMVLHADDAVSLRRWKRLELLRVAARDLLGLDDLSAVGRALAAMADDVLRTACRLAAVPALAIVGMGKLGGNELNYASDVDVLFVASDPETGAGAGAGASRAVMDVARTCFRVDADLRPEGRDGPLARSLESYRSYWDRWAEPWEFQALLKARPVAGDGELGAAFWVAAAERVWGHAFDADDLRSLRAMKARAEGELARRHLTDREVKRGRGGIRDIEFAVQLLQLVHGRHDEGIRSPTTLTALAQLADAGYVGADDATSLAASYRFLRAIEHRLQLVDEQQVHAIPTDGGALTRLARVLGYRDNVAGDAPSLLTADLRQHQATVRSIYERLYFRPLLEAFAVVPGAGDGGLSGLSVEAAEARLTAFGFADVERTRVALRDLAGGLTRSSRLMQQMLPLLLGWLSEAPDPDLGLLGLRRLSSGEQRTTELVTAFRESPEVARRLCLLLGTSRLFAEAFEHNPDELLSLGDPEGLAARPAADLAAGASTALQWRTDQRERRRGLLRFRQREELRIGARDVLGLDDEEDAVAVTGTELTALAEAALAAGLEAAAPPVPFAVVAMGRFGGAELSYASDLDVLFVYDGSTAAEFSAAENTAESLLDFLGGRTPPIYAVDLGLRPEGKQGPLARSLAGYRTYYDRWALLWERQALLRARAVAGDLDVGRRFMELIEPHVWRPLTDDDVRDIRRMKARIERERLPAGEDPQFHLKLGRGSLSDIEFTAQLLQLQHGVPATGTMAALEALTGAGVLDPEDQATLAAAYRFCEHTRNRWFLVKGSPGDALPTQGDQLARLARSLGTTGGELREQYRRVTRRARQVVERLFYGK